MSGKVIVLTCVGVPLLAGTGYNVRSEGLKLRVLRMKRHPCRINFGSKNVQIAREITTKYVKKMVIQVWNCDIL